MHTKSVRLAKRAAYYAVFAAFSAFALSACIDADRGENTVLEYAQTPGGGIVPAGLREIERGMTQPQVRRILGSRHSLTDIVSKPLIDYFTYSEDGVTKYIEIWYYENGRVSQAFYGYESRKRPA